MESISRQNLWDGLAIFAADAAEYINSSSSSSSSSLLSRLSSLNDTSPPHAGGSGGASSFFEVFPENGSTATPHTLAQPPARNVDLARAEITVLALILALTTMGNCFVLWVLLRRKKHNAPMHLFMVNLCVADLVVAFFQVSLLSGSDISQIVLSFVNNGIWAVCQEAQFPVSNNHIMLSHQTLHQHVSVTLYST